MTNGVDTAGKGQRWLPFAFLAGVFLIWLPSLAGPFQFDDYNVIVNFASVHSVTNWWHSLPGIRPLLKLTYALNWSLSPAPFGFHFFNLLVHLLNGALLLAWSRRTLPLPERAHLGLMGLWLLHPVQTEAVTYIAGRSVLLSTTFLLAGLLVLAHQRHGHRALAALCTLLALAVRETAWIFPFVFLLVQYLRGHSMHAALRAATPSLLVVSMAVAVFLLEPHFRRLLDVSVSLRSGDAQLRAQVEGLGYLLRQLVSLTPNIDPDIRIPPQWTPALALQAVALLSALLASAWVTLRQRSWAMAGLAWFFLLLVPTNSFMPRVDIASERHLYPALAGPLWALLMMLERSRARTVLAALLALVLAVATLIRNEDYRSELALWGRTSAQSPGKARPWNNLGIACRDAGHDECAREAFQRAMKLDAQDSRAATNLYFLKKKAATPE